MKNKYCKPLLKSLFVLAVVTLTACGSDKSNSELSSIVIKVKEIKGLELEGKDYVVTLGNKSARLVNGSAEFDVESIESTVSTLSTEFGEPILASFMGSDGELSIESSADVFVIRNPVFYGIRISDMKELSNKIRSHEQYLELVTALEKEVVNSPCPMDISCSMVVALIANEIAEEIDFSDLVE